MCAGFGPGSRRQGVGQREASQADGRWQIGKYGGVDDGTPAGVGGEDLKGVAVY
jgi:hypothetical protein